VKYLLRAALALTTTVAWSHGVLGEEGRHPGVIKLLEKLSPEGLSGKVIRLSRTEAGRRALEEALDACAAWKIRSLERDAETHFEEHLFTRDSDGFVTLRPENRDALARVSARGASAKIKIDSFCRRADEVGGRLAKGYHLGT
jgi:hypothetical protein